MARGDISQTIRLTGGEEVRRALEQIGQAGERAGSQTRQGLLAAAAGANSFAAGSKAAGASSGQLRFALQNLSFQVNDVVTGLATGGDVMRVFAQQGGQIFQVFQQGGGASAVLGGVATAIRGMITPMTAAVAAAAAVSAGFALLISRAAGAENSARQFDVILQATGRSGGITGKQLEEAAEHLHDLGLSASEAREQFKKFIGEGGIASQAPKIARIGAELNAVLGQGSLERFVSAAAKGGAPLEEIARQLGIVVPVAGEAEKAFAAAAKSVADFNKSIADALQKRSASAADVARDAARQLADLARQQGRQSGLTGDPRVDAARQRAAQEEDIEIRSKQRIEDINRQHAETINNLLIQRNEANVAALAAYNEKITTAAQQVLDKTSLIQQIGEKAFGSFRGQLSPLQEAVITFSESWNKMLDTLAKSETFTQLVTDLGGLVRSIADAIKWADKLADAIRKIPGRPSGGSGPTKTLWGGQVELAGGGLVRGPGTGISDSIVARISNGEFVMPALATKMYLPILEAMRSMNQPLMPRTRQPRGFATGGLVAAGAAGGGAPVHIHLDGKSFQLSGEQDVVEALGKHARSRAVRSGGRAPSWVG
jgi:hypothetical protein